jgi:hypothetical protein
MLPGAPEALLNWAAEGRASGIGEKATVLAHLGRGYDHRLGTLRAHLRLKSAPSPSTRSPACAPRRNGRRAAVLASEIGPYLDFGRLCGLSVVEVAARNTTAER